MPTVTFQQGVNYSGTIDVTIRQSTPDAAPGSATTLQVNGGVQTLLAFNGLFGTGQGQIPVGATITSATLTLKTSDASGSGVSVSRMLMDWTERSSWNSLGNGVQLDETEAASTADLVITRAPVGLQTFDVTGSLLAWLSGATTAEEANAANHGWVFTALGTNLWAFKSSESGAVPVLTVTYSMPGDPPQLALAGPVSQAEGTSSTATQFMFTVNRTGDTGGSVSVDYAVTGSGSAPAGASDFAGSALPSGTITFAPGEQSRTITVNVNADLANEANETFQVTLSGATGGAQITGATATGTIVNDDASGIAGVRIYDASTFGGSHGSPDPTDVAYDPSTGKFFVSDSEVDESPFFANTNLFMLDGDADPLQSYSLRGFTSEPTGLALWVDPDTGVKRLFICSDDQKRIFVVDPADPTVVLRSFSTTAFNVGDPEDLSINPNNGNLFVLSENDKSIYEVTQNGVFVSKVTLPSPFSGVIEGLAYDAQNDQFYVCGGFSSKIYIVSRSGSLLGTIDVLLSYPRDDGGRVIPKGLELAPSSDGLGNLSLWVTDYGRDQIADGRLIEIMLDRPAQQASTVTASAAAFEPFEALPSFDAPALPLYFDPAPMRTDPSDMWMGRAPLDSYGDVFF